MAKAIINWSKTKCCIVTQPASNFGSFGNWQIDFCKCRRRSKRSHLTTCPLFNIYKILLRDDRAGLLGWTQLWLIAHSSKRMWRKALFLSVFTPSDQVSHLLYTPHWPETPQHSLSRKQEIQYSLHHLVRQIFGYLAVTINASGLPTACFCLMKWVLYCVNFSSAFF